MLLLLPELSISGNTCSIIYVYVYSLLGLSNFLFLCSAADALKLSIENSKYLGGWCYFYKIVLIWFFLRCLCCVLIWVGDVEHTHLVKGLDYALLNKVRSEIDKKPDGEDDDSGKTRLVFV